MIKQFKTHANAAPTDVFHAPGMLNFTNPAGQLATDDDPLVVHKFISQPLFGGGQVILRPGAEKGRQFVRNDTMVSRKSFGLCFCKNAAENLAVEYLKYLSSKQTIRPH